MATATRPPSTIPFPRIHSWAYEVMPNPIGSGSSPDYLLRICADIHTFYSVPRELSRTGTSHITQRLYSASVSLGTSDHPTVAQLDWVADNLIGILRSSIIGLDAITRADFTAIIDK